jgi:hypothetical protein
MSRSKKIRFVRSEIRTAEMIFAVYTLPGQPLPPGATNSQTFEI